MPKSAPMRRAMILQNVFPAFDNICTPVVVIRGEISSVEMPIRISVQVDFEMRSNPVRDHTHSVYTYAGIGRVFGMKFTNDMSLHGRKLRVLSVWSVACTEAITSVLALFETQQYNVLAVFE